MPRSIARGEKGVTLVATYPIAYPDAKHDAEAVFVLEGKVHIVSKERGEGETALYRLDRLQTRAQLGADARNVAARVGSGTATTSPGSTRVPGRTRSGFPFPLARVISISFFRAR